MMKRQSFRGRLYLEWKSTAQGTVEYALLLVLLALVLLAGLSLLGVDLGEIYARLPWVADPSYEESEPRYLAIQEDFMDRIESFYAENNRWPRSWGDYRFTDLGLDPADWSGLVEGIRWNPNGEMLGLSNPPGDPFQIYVEDTAGNKLHLYDGWNIWCPAYDENCYYHSVAPQNIIRLETLVVVEE